MSIFDMGRPSGFLGGRVQSNKDRLDTKEQEVDIASKQAAFFDYMDAIESRQQARATQIAEDKARVEVLPSETEKTKAENKLGKEKAEVGSELLPLQKEDTIRQVHARASAQNRQMFAGAHQNMLESLKNGASKEDVYARTMAILDANMVDKAKATATYKALGITPGKYSDKAFDALVSLTRGSMHMGGPQDTLGGVEHMTAMEYGLRLQLEASKSGKPLKEGKPVDVENVSMALSGYPWFSSMDEELQAQAASQITMKANAMQEEFGPGVSPSSVAPVLMEILGAMKDDYINLKYGPGSDRFNVAAFDGQSQEMISLAVHLANVSGRTFSDVWATRGQELILKTKRENLVEAQKDADRNKEQQESVEKTRPPKEGNQDSTFSQMKHLERIGQKGSPEWIELYLKAQEQSKSKQDYLEGVPGL